MQPEFQAYYQSTGKLSARALQLKALKGECVGCAPTGYLNVTSSDGKRVIVDPQLGSLVRRAFELAGKSRTSIRRIITELTPQGLVSRNGTPLSAPALRNILTNPFYIGFIRYKGRLLVGEHQPLVSKSLFDRVQERLSRRRRRDPKTIGSDESSDLFVKIGAG